MPFPMIKASGVVNVNKEDAEKNSLDLLIRQAIGKEPFLSFSRVNDTPVPWIQLLNALEQQDVPGWPLLSPLKIQMQKCDKCSKEFCSTINYRRHMRLHRRNLNLDKDSTAKNRGLLQVFWDKLFMEKTMEIMSFEDVLLEGVTGPSLIDKLSSLIRKPGLTSLPQSYIKAGSVLLDIVQGRRSRFPISSQELFSVLDDASEKTFLCAGTADSLQKYVFDGEAEKMGLEMRNVVACTSFLVEQKLVKACLADKDAEALRYHKLLVEEEEAAQKRQAAVLEKKRQKQLRLKAQRVKEQASAETDYPDDRSPSPSSSPILSPDFTLELSGNTCSPVDTPEPMHRSNLEGYVDKDHEIGSGLDTYQNGEHKMLLRNGRRPVDTHWQALKSQRSANGFHASHNYQVLKPGTMQKHSYRDSRSTSTSNGGKIWTAKPKSKTPEETFSTRLQVRTDNAPSEDKKGAVLIGSISVALKNQSGQKNDENLGGAAETCTLEHSVPAVNGFVEKPNKMEAIPGTTNRSSAKQWRPMSRLENGGQLPLRDCNEACEVIPVFGDDSAEDQLVCQEENNSRGHEENPDSLVEGEHEGGLRFSSQFAEAFLAMRWKEVISSEHVKLVLFPEAKPPPTCLEVEDDNQAAVASSSKLEHGGIPTSTGNSSILTPNRTKVDKGNKVKYIPKQRYKDKETT